MLQLVHPTYMCVDSTLRCLKHNSISHCDQHCYCQGTPVLRPLVPRPPRVPTFSTLQTASTTAPTQWAMHRELRIKACCCVNAGIAGCTAAPVDWWHDATTLVPKIGWPANVGVLCHNVDFNVKLMISTGSLENTLTGNGGTIKTSVQAAKTRTKYVYNYI
jgi:hypothetical protein